MYIFLPFVFYKILAWPFAHEIYDSSSRWLLCWGKVEMRIDTCHPPVCRWTQAARGHLEVQWLVREASQMVLNLIEAKSNVVNSHYNSFGHHHYNYYITHLVTMPVVKTYLGGGFSRGMYKIEDQEGFG